MIPLEGIVVLDCSATLAGAMCSLQLVDAGADVYRIDIAGSNPSLGGADGNPALDHLLHRGKKSVALDLNTEAGRRIFLKMTESADVVIEETAHCPHVDSPYRADTDEMLAANPRLIHCVIGPWPSGSSSTPWLTELEIQGLAAQMAFMGSLGDEPVRCGIDIGLVASAVYASVGITSALWAREFTGAGQRVDISTVSAILSVSSHWLADFSDPDEYLGGNTSPYSGPDHGYECRDGRAIFGFFGRRVDRKDPWQALCTALGLEDLLDDEYLREHGAGIVGGGTDALLWRPIIEGRTKEIDAEDLMDIVQEIGGAGAPVYSYDQLFTEKPHPQVEAIGVLRDVDAGEQRLRGVVAPWANDLNPEAGQQPAPTFGADTDAALARFGITQDEIDKARKERVIP